MLSRKKGVTAILHLWTTSPAAPKPCSQHNQLASHRALPHLWPIQSDATHLCPILPIWTARAALGAYSATPRRTWRLFHHRGSGLAQYQSSAPHLAGYAASVAALARYAAISASLARYRASLVGKRQNTPRVRHGLAGYSASAPWADRMPCKQVA